MLSCTFINSHSQVRNQGPRALFLGPHGFFLLFFFVVSNHFFKISFRNTIGVSSSMDPDQAQHFVRPDLGPNKLFPRVICRH